MADELNTQEAGGDTYLDEIHKALEKDEENGESTPRKTIRTH